MLGMFKARRAEPPVASAGEKAELDPKDDA
jgi:hypothetical protein